MIKDKPIKENIIRFSLYDLEQTNGFGARIDYEQYESLTHSEKNKLIGELRCCADDLHEALMKELLRD